VPATGSPGWNGSVPAGTGTLSTGDPIRGGNTFVEEALAAEASCPVSRALSGVPEITVDASLAR
jgi:organic hydroperoxide reductase OsmC/OhrA